MLINPALASSNHRASCNAFQIFFQVCFWGFWSYQEQCSSSEQDCKSSNSKFFLGYHFGGGIYINQNKQISKQICIIEQSIKNLNFMQLSHSILDGLDKLISNMDQYKRKEKNLEYVKHSDGEVNYINDANEHNVKYKKSLHQILAQTCQSVFDIILSQSQKVQFKKKLCPKRSGSVNDSNEEFDPPSTNCDDWVHTLYEQMNRHPKCFIKLKNILKVDKIASIFEAQLPCIEIKQQKQQIHISILRRAIKQYSQKLWVNNQYVRCLDLDRYKRGTRHITLFYIDELSPSMAHKQQILALFDQHFQSNKIENPCQLQLQVQLIETCVEPSAKSQFCQSSLWQHEGEIEIDSSALKKTQDSNKNVLYSAWVYTRFSDSRRADMNKKIQHLQQKIMQKRPHIECNLKLKIYLPQQHRLSEEITEDLIEGISKLSINPFISHQNEKMFSQQTGPSDGLLFHFDNSLFFNS